MELPENRKILSRQTSRLSPSVEQVCAQAVAKKGIRRGKAEKGKTVRFLPTGFKGTFAVPELMCKMMIYNTKFNLSPELFGT